MVHCWRKETSWRSFIRWLGVFLVSVFFVVNKMVNTAEHHGPEKAIIDALLKISEIVKKSAAGRLSEKSRQFLPQSSRTLDSGDIKRQSSEEYGSPRSTLFQTSNRQVSAARRSWKERRCMCFFRWYQSVLSILSVTDESVQPVCGKRKSCVHRRTGESSRKRRRYDTSSTSSNERDSHLIHKCRQRRYTKHRVGCRCQVSKHDQHSTSNCWNRIMSRRNRRSLASH